MRPRPETRDPGSAQILEGFKQHGLDIYFLPDGTVSVCWSPDHKLLVFTSERKLGAFLAALIVDTGGHPWRPWRMRRES